MSTAGLLTPVNIFDLYRFPPTLTPPTFLVFMAQHCTIHHRNTQGGGRALYCKT